MANTTKNMSIIIPNIPLLSRKRMFIKFLSLLILSAISALLVLNRLTHTSLGDLRLRREDLR